MDLGEADRLVSIATLSEPEGEPSDANDATEETES
jgi:hypothetical protein